MLTIIWLVPTVAALVANIIYCTIKARADFESGNRAMGFVGVVAALGVVSFIAFSVLLFLFLGFGGI